MVGRRQGDDGPDPVAGRRIPHQGGDGGAALPKLVDDGGTEVMDVIGSGPLADRLSGMDSETEVIEVIGSGPLIDRLSGMDSETEVIEHVVTDPEGDADGLP